MSPKVEIAIEQIAEELARIRAILREISEALPLVGSPNER
jgi:hypothetical protein